MYLTVQGLVLRVTTYNDTDALLNILTHSHGGLTVKARGLKRKNSPLTAPCQLLAFSEFILFENRGHYTINEAKALELFQPLHRQLQEWSLGTDCLQAAQVLCQEDLPNPDLLSLVLNSLFALSRLNLREELVKAVFELRAACLAGYTPDLTQCHQCGCLNADRFDLSAGVLECHACRSLESNGIRMPLNQGTLEAMRYICYCDKKQLFSFQIGEDSLRFLSQIAESYLATQLERSFSTLDFYKTLLIE